MATPWGFKMRSSTSFIIFAVCLGLYTDSITASSIIPILPSALVERAGVPEDHVQFYISAFMASFSVTFIVAAPVFGNLADRLKTKRQPFIWGMVANIISLLLYMKATTIIGMAIARALQGVSSSAILVVGTAMIKDSVTIDKTGMGMALTTAAIQLGLIMGPAFGGLVYDNYGYEAVFITPALLLALDIVLRLLIIEEPVSRSTVPQKRPASSSGSIGYDPERQPLIDSASNPGDQGKAPVQGGNRQAWSGKVILQRFPVLNFFLNGRMLTALLTSMVDSICWGALESTIPLFVIRTFNWSPTEAGTLFLISCTPGVILSYVMGSVIDSSGSLYPAVFGLAVAGACHLTQRLVHLNILRDKILLTSLFTTSNLSMLFVQITMSVEIGQAAQEIGDSLATGEGGGRLVGQGYAWYMMVQSFGQLVGPVIGGAMIETVGWAGMTTLLATMLLVALPLVLLFTGGGIARWRTKSG